MILADFQTSFGQGILAAGFFLWVGAYFIKKFLAANPSVKDAANKAAANKAIDAIGKFLK